MMGHKSNSFLNRYSSKIQLKIRAKLAIGFLAVLTLTLLVSGVALYTQYQTQNTLGQLLNVDIYIAQLANDSSIAMLRARRAESSYLLHYKELGFEVAYMEFLPEIQAQVATIHQNMDKIRQLTTDNEAIIRSEAIDQAITEYETTLLTTIEQLRQRGHNNTGLEGQFNTSVQAIEQWVEDQQLDQLKIDMLEMRRQEKDYLLRSETKYVELLHQAVTQFNNDIAASNLPPAKKLELTTFAADYQGLFDLLVQTDAQIEASKEAYQAAVQKLEPLVEAYQLAALEAQDAKQATMQNSAQMAAITVISASLGAVVIGLVITFFLSRSISHAVVTIAQAAGSIAEGDVEQQLKVRGKDELGEMAAAFTRMIAYLKEMVSAANRLAEGNLTADITPRSDRDVLGHAFSKMMTNLALLVAEVQNSATQVETTAVELAAPADQVSQATTRITITMQQMAAGTTQQAESLAKTSALIEQVARTIDGVAQGAQEQAAAVTTSAAITSQITTAIQQVAQNAQAGAKGAAEAAELARVGVATVEASIEGMESIKAKVDLSAQKVREMGQHSQQIGVIVETIDGIASQTNLLALNAAIEAARAGEHGRGFAVVADEVRKLAEKSTLATKEIAKLIGDIQQTVTEAVQAMDKGAKEVEVGVTQVHEGEQALTQILTATEGVSCQVSEISEAAQAMNTAAQELVTAMASVSAVVEENRGATRAMAAKSAEIRQDIEYIASVSEETCAAAQEVNAMIAEVNALAGESSTSAQNLAQLANELRTLAARFKIKEAMPDGRPRDGYFPSLLQAPQEDTDPVKETRSLLLTIEEEV